MTITIRRAVLAIGGAVLFLAACVALGGTPADGDAEWGEARSAVVRHADLDLATASGVETLRRRMAAAVEEVCALPNGGQLSQIGRVKECREHAQRQVQALTTRLVRQASQRVARGE
jgi:UrcA family protein